MVTKKKFTKLGWFGNYGGQFVPETVSFALEELEQIYLDLFSSEKFWAELDYLSKRYAGRPTPLYSADRLACHYAVQKVYIKREDLLHTGAHKLNNALGQALLAKKLGKNRIIAETGAGQHGVAVSAVCAMLGLKCVIYMGKVDYDRQKSNVFRMKLHDAEIVQVEAGSGTLKEAINEALRDWITNVENSHYLIGSAIGPHPYPLIVKQLQRVIGDEARLQYLEATNKLPDAVFACVGGGSNAIGLFTAFKNDTTVRKIGIEAGGSGLDKEHSATLVKGKVGVLHGSKSYLLYDKNGQIQPTHSISAGLDYPGVGPEHSYFKDEHIAEYYAATDIQALSGFHLVAIKEGIIPALEPAHVFGFLEDWLKTQPDLQNILVLLSGRGDKDLDIAMQHFQSKN